MLIALNGGNTQPPTFSMTQPDQTLVVCVIWTGLINHPHQQSPMSQIVSLHTSGMAINRRLKASKLPQIAPFRRVYGPEILIQVPPVLGQLSNQEHSKWV
ncbi:Hypothetical predicted protein [Xyrichtys novacula]|uniref:Uncharacterized protein n=1 Tax=Xyrichtys novacula TaxID=13765 RepID=A0AAV1F1E6_XYRNO|nr:Hypothetical predicted protein [Xyrichtys novacula]